MVKFWSYMYKYIKALVTQKYLVGSGPAFMLLILSLIPFHSMLSNYPTIGQALSKPYLNPLTLTLGFVFAIGTALWLGYDLLNQETGKLDADNVRTSPRVREDRAYRLIHQLILEAEELSKYATVPPDLLMKWDEKVRAALADWCDAKALKLYLNNSRPLDQEWLKELPRAIEGLKDIFRSLDRHIK